MMPPFASNPKFNKVIISTGNILNVNKKPARKSNEELLEGLKLTLQCCEEGCVELNEISGQVLRGSQELSERILEHERSNISIGAKIFLNKHSTSSIRDAVQGLLNILNVQQVDNVVLAYHPKPEKNTRTSPLSPGVTLNGDSYGILRWNSKDEDTVAELKALWEVLEEYAQQKKIAQLGISDLDMDTLSRIYTGSSVQPSIAQINLSSCCVVPPALQEFCNKHDIQLLTHSDPEIILENVDFMLKDYNVDWVARYQVHIRCRGVLTAKGYIIGATKVGTTP